ncbi:hypothetical protein HZB04_03845, partial [Candidatus Wolfebacteria bacterium]|nr:hypothetical protein [Candidatus Wolfebacteria bacterium]
MKFFKPIFIFFVFVLFFSGFFVFDAKADYEGTKIGLRFQSQEQASYEECVDARHKDGGYHCEVLSGSSKTVDGKNMCCKNVSSHFEIFDEDKITKGDPASVSQTSGTSIFEVKDSGGNVVKYVLDNTVGVVTSFIGNVLGGFNSSKTENRLYVFDVQTSSVKYLEKYGCLDIFTKKIIECKHSDDNRYILDPTPVSSTLISTNKALYNVEKKEDCSFWGTLCSTSTNFNKIGDVSPSIGEGGGFGPSCLSWSSCTGACGGGAGIQYCTNPNDPSRTQGCTNAQVCTGTTPTPTPTNSIKAYINLNGSPYDSAKKITVNQSFSGSSYCEGLTSQYPTDTFSNNTQWDNQPLCTYTISVKDGIPGAMLTSIAPSGSQTLTENGSITFTFNFYNPPTVSLSATYPNNQEIEATDSIGADPVANLGALSWSSTNATTCTASGS